MYTFKFGNLLLVIDAVRNLCRHVGGSPLRSTVENINISGLYEYDTQHVSFALCPWPPRVSTCFAFAYFSVSFCIWARRPSDSALRS